MAPIVAVVVGFLLGGGAPALSTLVGGIGTGVADVDRLASTVASYAPAVCRATDPIIDRAVDAENARAGGKVTFWRRLANDLGAAADAVCADAATLSNTPINRARAVVDAVAAVNRANNALGSIAPAAPVAAPAAKRTTSR